MIPSIQLMNGSFFNFDEPDQATYTIEDIAHALANICRFTGHTSEFYSVAQHSVLASHLVPAEHALAALMHDAAEAFLGDVSSPLKQLLPEYKRIEHRVEAAIMARCGIPFPLDPCVKAADRRMLVTERRDLMPLSHGSEEWAWTDSIKPMLGRITPWPARAARDGFLGRFRALTS